MKPALLPLLVAGAIGLGACSAPAPRPGISVDNTSIRYGHGADITVHTRGEILQLMAGPGAAVQNRLFTAPAASRALLPAGNEFLVLAPGRLLRYDRNGTLLHSLDLDGYDRGMDLAGELLLSWGDRGVALHRLQPQQVHTFAHISIAAGVRHLTLHNNTLWLVSGDRRLQAYSLDQDPPRPVAGIDLSDEVHDLDSEGRYLYLATGAEGILVIDSRDEAAPQAVARYHTSGEAWQLRIDNGIAYIADGHNGLSIADISEPLHIRQLGSFNHAGDARRLRLHDSRVLLSDSSGLQYLLDVSNSFRPRLEGTWKSAGNAEFTATGDSAYSLDKGFVQQLGLDTPVLPAISSEGVNLGGSRRARIVDGLLYVADWFSGLHIYDIRDPQHPLHIGNYHTPGSAKGVMVERGFAWVGDDDQGLQIIDVSDPHRPQKAGHMPTSGLAYTMKKSGNLLFVADHRGGFYIVDSRDPAQSRQLAHFKTSGKAWAIDVADNTAFVADDDGGILAVDVSTPEQPVLISSFNPGGQAEDIIIRGHIAYCAFFDKGFYVLDISDPAHMRQLAHIPIPGNARGIVLDGDIAWVAAWYGGLQAVDISKPEQPHIVGRLDTDGSLWGVRLHGKHAWLLDWWGGVKVADISDPRRPRLLGRYHARDRIRSLALRGNYVWQAAGRGGLQVFDIRNALNPIWVTGLDSAGTVSGLTLADDEQLWFLASTSDGQAQLHITDISNPFYLREIAVRDLPVPGRQITWSAGQAFVLGEDGQVRVMRSPGDNWQATTMADQGITHMLSSPQHLFLADNKHLRVYRSHDLTRPASLVELPGSLSALAAGQGRLLLHIEGDGFHLYAGRNSAYRAVSHYPYPGKVHSLRLHEDRLLATTDNGLLTLAIDDNDGLGNGQTYPALTAVTDMAAINDKVFFAGSPLMSSVTLLPATPVQHINTNEARIRFPDNLPLGSYQIRGIAADGSQPTSEIINVELRRPQRPRLDPELFKRMMKSPTN